MRRNDNTPLMRSVTGTPGIAFAVLAWLLMTIASAASAPSFTPTGGILLLPPAEWGLSHTLSCILGALLTLLCAQSLWLLNKTHSILPGPSGIYIATFLVLTAAMPAAGSSLSGSMLTLAILLPCVHILFSLHGRRKTPYGCFLIFSTLGWGSMLQGACLWLMPVFLAGMACLQVFRVREVAAALLGVLTPFWIMFGLGLASPASLQWPEPLFISQIPGSPTTIIALLIPAGTAALLLVILMLYNALNTLSEGVRMRALHTFINLLGLACIVLIVFDCRHLPAYLSTLIFCIAFVLARTFTLTRSPRAWILPVSIYALFIIIYISLS